MIGRGLTRTVDRKRVVDAELIPKYETLDRHGQLSAVEAQNLVFQPQGDG